MEEEALWLLLVRLGIASLFFSFYFYLYLFLSHLTSYFLHFLLPLFRTILFFPLFGTTCNRLPFIFAFSFTLFIFFSLLPSPLFSTIHFPSYSIFVFFLILSYSSYYYSSSTSCFLPILSFPNYPLIVLRFPLLTSLSCTLFYDLNVSVYFSLFFLFFFLVPSLLSPLFAFLSEHFVCFFLSFLPFSVTLLSFLRFLPFHVFLLFCLLSSYLLYPY